MKMLNLSILPERISSFLKIRQLRVEGSGVLCVADFDLALYNDQLFTLFYIDLPKSLSKSVFKRRAEYLAGRIISRVAQIELGVEGQVRIGLDGSPIWPQGLSRSISHARSRCACLVVPELKGSPGIDIEMIASQSEISTILFTTIDGQERNIIESGDNLAVNATLCFSAKETLFKALYPIVRRRFGFECARLTSLPRRGRVQLTLTEVLHPHLPQGRTFSIQYETDKSHALTWMIGQRSQD